MIVEEDGLQATELARALCAKASECSIEELGALTLDECALYFSLPCLRFSNVRAEDGLAACVASIRAASCGDNGIVSEICEDAFARARARETGAPLQTAEGGQCGDGVDCANGMSCDGFGSECGVCSDGPRVGDPCEDGCWEGYCDPATNICTQYKADGEPCANDDECDSFNCSATGLCKPSPEEDFGLCSFDDECESGRCVEGQCLEEQPPGGSCTTSRECDNGFCDDGVCKLLARCSLGEAGEPCGLLGCSANLDCMNGICVALPGTAEPNGASCLSESDCASGFCAFSSNTNVSVCAARPADHPCDDNDQCASGSCVNYQCTGTGLCGP